MKKSYVNTAASIALIGLTSISSSAFAHNVIETNGGLKATNHENSDYWFKVSGVIKLDQTFFMGGLKDKKSDAPLPHFSPVKAFSTGGNVRDVGLTFEGGIGYNISYTLGLDFDAFSQTVDIDEASISFNPVDNWTFSIGQVNPYFSLDVATSSKYISFLERSLPAVAFAPNPGVGVSATGTFADMFSVAGSITQAKIEKDPNPGTADRWAASGRLNFVPVKDDCKVFQVGVSGTFQDVSRRVENAYKGVEFSTHPEARARDTQKIINTTTNTGEKIRAKNYNTFNFEIAGQYGPLLAQAEYYRAAVNRFGNPLGNVHFNGYEVQASWVITGESKQYDFNQATFGKISPKNKCGALEIAARYSYVNLNHKDVRGGSEHNTAIGLNWYVNNNLKFVANYIHATMSPRMDAPKRHLDILALRGQVAF